jgi:hypothetical protein
MEIANPSTKTLGFVCFHGAKKINIDPPYSKDGSYHHATKAPA